MPKYGAGLCLRTVAWISGSSSVGARATPLPAADSLTVDMPAFPLVRVQFRSRPRTNDHHLSRYSILSRNSSAALPSLFNRSISAKVSSGLATNQPSAVIWCLTR